MTFAYARNNWRSLVNKTLPILSQIIYTGARGPIYSILITMPHTPLHTPDPKSLPSTLTKLLKFTPRDGQIEAIRTLAIDQLDLILIAPTGWGKSAIFQAVPALRGGICLMIMPLNLLEEGQVSKDRTGKNKKLTNLAIGQVYCSNIWL